MTTRSKSTKTKPESSSNKNGTRPTADQKIFFFDEELLQQSENLKIELFYHPGKDKRTYFIAEEGGKNLFEVKEFAEPRRSWLINKNTCSNGKVYITVPVDGTFLALYFLKKFCSERAMSLDDIVADDDSSVHKFLSTYAPKDRLEAVTDVKTSAGQKYYKYNPKKTLAWLAIKVRKLVDCLKRENIYCGFSSLSQNYKKSEFDQTVDDADYLRNACEIVGTYVDLATYNELKNYLGIVEAENKAPNNKRKSTSADTSLSKKVKVEDVSFEETTESPKAAAPVKEKKVTAKDKALAKGAKGTMSISSFFKK